MRPSLAPARTHGDVESGGVFAPGQIDSGLQTQTPGHQVTEADATGQDRLLFAEYQVTIDVANTPETHQCPASDNIPQTFELSDSGELVLIAANGHTSQIDEGQNIKRRSVRRPFSVESRTENELLAERLVGEDFGFPLLVVEIPPDRLVEGVEDQVPLESTGRTEEVVPTVEVEEKTESGVGGSGTPGLDGGDALAFEGGLES